MTKKSKKKFAIKFFCRIFATENNNKTFYIMKAIYFPVDCSLQIEIASDKERTNETFILAVAQNIDKMVRDKDGYIFVSEYYKIGTKTICPLNRWIITEEPKTGADFFRMNPEMICKVGGIEYVANDFIKNSYYFKVGGKYYYIDR